MAVAVLGCQDPRCYSSLMARSAGDDSPRSMAEQLAEVLWGPEPSGTRGPRPVLTRATVIEAAIAIADSEGLSATSLRAIAGRLGVSVAGLYRYAAGKTELIALMVEHARREVVVASRASTGREGLEDRAMADWDLYHRHAWLLDVPMGRVPAGPSTVAHFDAGLAAALDAGLTPPRAVSLVTSIDHLVTGAARDSLDKRAFARDSGMDPLQWWKLQGEVVIERRMAEGEFPALAQVITAEGFDRPVSPNQRGDIFREAFRESLRSLLDGGVQQEIR